MEKVELEDLKKIEGGISIWGAIGIGSAVVFIIGVIDGFFRPLKCNWGG